MQEEVPDEPYFIRHGQALVRRTGRDLTLVSFGAMMPMVMEAADRLAARGISAEVVDLRTLSPLDMAAVRTSAAKTGRLVVAEMGWLKFGVAAEIISGVCEAEGHRLLARPRRIGWPHSFVPTSSELENAFYPKVESVFDAAVACFEEK
jgi:pyruvate/2-oxoglutarate/acetoin dehydrogenase E1 component